MKKTVKLKKILESNETVLIPGIYDAFSAKIFQKVGFNVLYMTGSGVTTALTGMPDMGILTMTEMVSQARNIANATTIPLICDADNGYGNSINVIRTVKEFERAGASGIHIEDQVFPKKSAQLNVKEIISRKKMQQKISVAINAREDKDFLIIARTDARVVEGLEKAVERAKSYVESGADMIFFEAVQSVDELEFVANELLRTRLMINVVEGGKTPCLNLKKYAEMGIKMVIYPTSSLRASGCALMLLANHLYKNQDTIDFTNKLMSLETKNQITDTENILKIDGTFI